jgi:hypothetical protein
MVLRSVSTEPRIARGESRDRDRQDFGREERYREGLSQSPKH